jgi:hypothetical protein
VARDDERIVVEVTKEMGCPWCVVKWYSIKSRGRD